MTLSRPTGPATAGPTCCPEYAALSRRGLFAGAVALAGATSIIGSAVVTASPAAAASASSVLVVLSLRGAADGLSLVVPHGDPAYYAARPRIAIPADRLQARDAFFGLHPCLAPLLPLWTSGRMAAVHAAGLPSANRSHFSAMEELEDANPGSAVRQGWLNRLVGTDSSSSPLQGLSVGSGVLPTSLYGPQSVMSVRDVDSMAIPGYDPKDKKNGRMRSLHTLWDGDKSPLGRGMKSTFGAVKGFSPALKTADSEASYPRSDLGSALSSVARIVRSDIGVQVVTVDQGDWDMHSDLGTVEWGKMNENAGDFASSVAAFFDDLGTQAGKVTLVALSEFGRRVAENDNCGLDHGYGNAMFVAGAGVRGGRYYGAWPGLTNSPEADLTVTTDYRNVLADVVASRFPAASVPAVFPGLVRTSVGVMA